MGSKYNIRQHQCNRRSPSGWNRYYRKVVLSFESATGRRCAVRNAGIFFLFYVSGACGLIYQVVWSRMMSHIFGSTVFAVSAVLAAFMAGLGIGSYFLGKRSDLAKNPLRWFACCEVGIGLSALLVVLLLNQITPFYVWMIRSLGHSSALLGFVRLVVAFALLLVPTTLMGATLPILSRFVITRCDRVGNTIAALYGINTLGAISGSLMAGFCLIGTLGIHRTVYLTVLLNVGVGIVAWLLSLKAASMRDTFSEKPGGALTALVEEPLSPAQKRLHSMLLWCFALSGATVFAYEVFWTRALIFFVGNSTYALVTMLSAFLAGIAAGSYAIRLFIDRLRYPIRFFAWVQVGIGVSAAMAMPLLIWLMGTDFVQGLLVDGNQQLRSGFATRFGLCFAVILGPTMLIGTTFPLVARIVLRNLNHTGADVGRVYAVNTLGNIVGALLPGLMLINLAGINKGIWLMALVNISIGFLLLVSGKSRFHPWRLTVYSGLAAAFYLLLVAVPHNIRFPAQGQTTYDEVLFYREGPMATTMVFVGGESGHKYMAVDGIVIGGTSAKLDYKQQWLAHLPKLLMEDPQSELSVGLGSGILAGESSRHHQLQKITCVEIAPSVVQGAKLFSAENYGILESLRADIVVDDAVNYLMASREKYDIISTDGKSEPGFSVNGTFFSREYYTLIRDRLSPGGVAIEWIALNYPPRIFRSALKTFTEVFPHVMLWQAHGNCFLVGSMHKVDLDTALISEKLRDGQLPFDGLKKYGITTAESLLSHLVAREDVLQMQLMGTKNNTIENPTIEFYDSKEFSVPSEKRELENLEFILSVRGKGAAGAWLKRLSDKVIAAYEAESSYLLGAQAILQGKGEEVFGPHFDQALSLSNCNEDIRYHLFGHYFATAQYFAMQRNIPEAESYIMRAVEIWPNDAESRLLFGRILIDNKRVMEAIDQFEMAVKLEPKRISIRHLLAKTYLSCGHSDKTISHLRAALDINPNDVIGLYTLGYLLGERDVFDEALHLLQMAYQIAPGNPRVVHCYAWITYRSGDRDKARKIVLKGGRYYEAAKEMKEARDFIMQSTR